MSAAMSRQGRQSAAKTCPVKQTHVQSTVVIHSLVQINVDAKSRMNPTNAWEKRRRHPLFSARSIIIHQNVAPSKRIWLYLSWWLLIVPIVIDYRPISWRWMKMNNEERNCVQVKWQMLSFLALSLILFNDGVILLKSKMKWKTMLSQG